MVNATSTEIDPILEFVENSWVQLAVTLGVLAVVFYELGVAIYNRANKSKLEKEHSLQAHRKALFEDFNKYWNQLLGFEFSERFKRLPDSKFVLQHIYTAYPDLDKALRECIRLEIGQQNKSIPFQEYQDKHPQARQEAKTLFIDFMGQIRRGVKELDGICHDCKELHTDKHKKEMLVRLDSFTMPF